MIFSAYKVHKMIIHSKPWSSQNWKSWPKVLEANSHRLEKRFDTISGLYIQGDGFAKWWSTYKTPEQDRVQSRFRFFKKVNDRLKSRFFEVFGTLHPQIWKNFFELWNIYPCMINKGLYEFWKQVTPGDVGGKNWWL